MCQPGCRLRLHTEFGDELPVIPKLLLEHLYCDEPVQLVILRLIYIRHTAGADFGYYFISVLYKHSDFEHIHSPFIRIPQVLRIYYLFPRFCLPRSQAVLQPLLMKRSFLPAVKYPRPLPYL